MEMNCLETWKPIPNKSQKRLENIASGEMEAEKYVGLQVLK